jgi:hypothetical protein
MLQLNFGAATLPGASSSDCAMVDPNGICVEGSRTTQLPEGGGMRPRFNIHTGTFQMQPSVAAGFQPENAPGSGGTFVDPGPTPPGFQPEPQVVVDASTIPGQEVTVTVPADQMYPGYAKYRIPRWALALGGLGLLALVISLIARR